MKSFKTLKELSTSDLEKKRDELYRELIKDKAQIAIGTMPKSPGKIKLTKKTIARIKMILSQEEKNKA